MKINNPLDAILDNQAQIRILRFLCRTGARWNGRQIAKEVGVTPATAHKALQSLNKEGILMLSNVGKTHVYTLNEDQLIVSDILKPLFAKEDRILDNIAYMIKCKISTSRLKRDIVSAALFGSVNAGRDHAGSDIDLVVIVENQGSKIDSGRLFEEIDKKVSKQFGNTVAPYINTLSEFRAKHKQGLGIIKSILKNYTVIYGKDLKGIL